jgi:hypothetical protein
VLHFHYQSIQLNRLNWRDFARRENPVASALMAKMNIAQGDRARVKLECIRLLVTLRLNKAKTQVILGFVDTYLGLDEAEEQAFKMELDKFAPLEKERIMEGRMTWRERDKQEGLQQGRQEGMAAVISRQIERRVGQVDDAARERIGRLTSDQLESLGEALLDFTGPKDLAKWLDSLHS